MFLEIALPTPLNRLFDYRIPTHLQDRPMAIGARVKVPFGRRVLTGIVMGEKSQCDLPASKIKEVIEILDENSLFPDKLLALLQWSARYYHHPLGEVLMAALPAPLRQGKLFNSPPEEGWHAKRDEVVEDQFKSTTPPCGHPSSGGEFKHLPLNTEQQIAFETIVAATGFQTFLLDGITGSGKTEIYLQLLTKVLESGKQALVLVPEIGLTPQLLKRFSDRFEIEIACYHSTLTDKARLTTWLAVRTGSVKLVIGTRSSLFLPFHNLGLMILDEEHDLSFKQHEGFRYSARDLAVYRAQLENIPLVLGSATPSLESYYNTTRKVHPYVHLKLRERAGGAAMPTLKLIDMRSTLLEAGMTPMLLQDIRKTLDADQQVLLFLNRRGFANIWLCHDCGFIAKCKHCDAALTLHSSPERLHCHHCDRRHVKTSRCPECASTQLIPVGTGTQQLEETLQRIFPDVPIIRIDRDSTRLKGSLQKQLDRINAGRRQILIGTQMIAKGHHFPSVTLVGILGVDNGLFSADFRALEQTAQLILQVAGRAGREALKGQVLLQTHHPDHPLMQRLLKQGYTAFLDQVLEERRAANWPPFAYLALLRAQARTLEAAMFFLKGAKSFALAQTEFKENIQCLGPISALMEKKAGLYRAQLLLRSPSRATLQQGLFVLCEWLETQSSSVRWSLDIDPMEM